MGMGCRVKYVDWVEFQKTWLFMWYKHFIGSNLTFLRQSKIVAGRLATLGDDISEFGNIITDCVKLLSTNPFFSVNFGKKAVYRPAE